ncbi:crotonase/enoyl-CoA hydratase family protein [Ktedonosporobacter rubrisoli]|uniref:Crotonase/enoyl-CoA hydratase family protein n=1 Tax=Ktedonosporobacter rubrisoli TaxID=2509675 RepID=A0A4P6JUI7_KTERU|nr:crotonase/enoyl-CoA hydratase family protein [Ktedonosporobacter rubrisoli]QBD79144.1 crotonase/enoyl-CoA hydratase family protein [Ktedonosporobacter rubrisoli]
MSYNADSPNEAGVILTERQGTTFVVTINRPEVRNALDSLAASALAQAFREFDGDDALAVAILTGNGGNFCAGFDLKAVAEGSRMLQVSEEGDGPLGVTRMLLSKPVIAAVEGYAVAGGLEIALWCDLRVAAENATFGVFNRRWGVPLVDGGTIRLPRLIGQSHALDLILTGRGVSGQEALSMGLANRLTRPGEALTAALTLANELARFPQNGLRSDRLSAYEQWSLSWPDALRNETRQGLDVLGSGESVEGAKRFASGRGRHGSTSDI